MAHPQDESLRQILDRVVFPRNSRRRALATTVGSTLAAVALVGVLSIPGSSGTSAPGESPKDQGSNPEQTPKPTLVYTGKFDVSRSYIVNNLHASKFAGVEITPDMDFVTIPNARFEETPQGPVIDVQATLADNSQVTEQIPCSPGEVGQGPLNGRDGAIVAEKGEVKSVGEITTSNGSPLTPDLLSQGTPGFGSMPTLQP
jgi:hypothetical protein